MVFNSDLNAIFKAGNLNIDKRYCYLCIKVADMSKPCAYIVSSWIYLLYCDCVNN